MRRNIRKVIAFVLSSAMALGSPISIFAEEPGQTAASGVGQMEGTIKPDVYQVILPTDINGVFDFVLDPQKLIEETNAAVYGGKTYEKGATVFFHRTEGQTAEYSSSSDHVTIINRSTMPVDILVKVSISQDSLGGITMTNDRGFTNDTNMSLYMALTDGELTVPIGEEGSYIQTTIPAAPEDAFEYNYDQERREYSYGLMEDLNGVQFPEYSFQLTGAANEKGDWSTVGSVALLVNVTWEVKPNQSIDSGESKNIVQDGASEQDSIFSQTLKTVPVEKETQEDENNLNSASSLSKEAVPAGKDNSDTDIELNSDMALDKDTGLDIDSVSGTNNTQDENMVSDTNAKSKEDKTPSIERTSYTLKEGKPLSIDVDLGSGSTAAAKIVSVKWKETDNELLGAENEADAVRYKEGKLVFSEDWVNECLAEMSKRPAVLVVTFDDAGNTEEEITLND